MTWRNTGTGSAEAPSRPALRFRLLACLGGVLLAWASPAAAQKTGADPDSFVAQVVRASCEDGIDVPPTAGARGIRWIGALTWVEVWKVVMNLCVITPCLA